MAKLTWDAVGSRYYETGIDHGVLYVDGQAGVSWNGLTSVKVTSTGGSADPQYIDGMKFASGSTNGDTKASLTALTVPEEFGACDGVGKLLYRGLFSTQQARKQFALSYQTLIGNDILSSGAGYKIHLLYNVTAAPTDRSYGTIGDSASPLAYSYDLTAIPKQFSGRRATAYLEISSLRFANSQMTDLMDILYGTASTDARMPTASELTTIFGV